MPTVELTWSEPFEIDASTSETVRYFVLPTDLGGDRSVTGVDVIPGSRAVVRHVSVYVDTTGQARAADAADARAGFATGFDGKQPIAVWWPGQSAVKLDAVGYALPSGADVVARVLYKKTWITEGQAFTDQTRVGLHLTEDGVGTIEHTVLSSPDEPAGRELVFSHTLDQDVSLLGLLPELEVEATELRVEAARRATPRRKSLERHARAIIGSAYFEGKLLSGPQWVTRSYAQFLEPLKTVQRTHRASYMREKAS